MKHKKHSSTDQTPTYTLAEAVKHQRATSLGIPLSPPQLCTCCNRPVSEETFGLCFNQSQIFHTGTEYSSYLILLKFFFFKFLLIGLAYSLPLLSLNYKSDGCLSAVACGNNILYSFSFFNSFTTQKNLNMVVYLVIPVVLLSIVLFLMSTRALCNLRIKQQQLALFPDSCVLLLELPFNHLTDQFIISRIDAWWQKEAKKCPQYFTTYFPQLISKKNREENLFSEQSEDKNVRWSRIVYEVIFSYNYPEFQAFKNQIEAFTLYFQNQAMINREEISALMNLHQRKRKMLHETAKNKFCLVIFKSPQYAHYFYKKTRATRFQKMFCFQNKTDFQIQEQTVEVERGHYPSEIYWQYLHLTSKQKNCEKIKVFVLFVAIVGGSSGGWYGVCLLHISLINGNSSFLQWFGIVVGVAVNLLIILFSILNRFVNSRQQRKTYSQQSFSYIIRTCLINLNLLCLSPIVIYCAIDYSLLWRNNGLLLIIYYMVGIYAAASLLLKYINIQSLTYCYNHLVLDQTQAITQQQANQKYQKPTFQLCQNIAHLLTMLFLTFMMVTLNPLIAFTSLAWFILFYLTEKINMISFCKQNQNHGQNLILSIGYLSQFSLLFFIASCFGSTLLASNYGVFSFNITMICILSVMTFISLVYLFLPIQQFFQSDCESQKLKQIEYYELKSGCLQLYQKYNNPYLYGVKINGKSNQEYSVRMKIFEQMNTMSKTLTQSLKQRLLTHQNPVLATQTKKQESQNQVDNIYFEYERKVNMKSSAPKIEIPRLFKASNHEWNNQAELSESDRVNINSLFSSDDESNKRLVKKIIKQKVKQEGKIQ